MPRFGNREAILESTEAGSRDEVALIQRILDGETDLFAELIEPYTPRLVRAVMGVVADRGAAEDVVQEAFMIAYQNLASFRGDGAFGGWLSRIAVRQGLRTRRRLKDWWGRFQSWDLGDVQPDDRPSGMVDEVDRWMVSLARLPMKERTALILHAVEGRSHAEISDMMDATIGTVGSWIFRARQRLEVLGATAGSGQATGSDPKPNRAIRATGSVPTVEGE